MSYSRLMMFLVAVSFGAFLLAGCETVDYPTDTTSDGMMDETMKKPGEVPISTVPLGAEIYLDGEFQGNTPMTVTLEEGKEYKLELKEEEHGYETQTFMINSKTGSVNVNMRKQR